MGKGTDFPRAKDMKAYECLEKTILTDYGQFMKRYNTEAEKIIQKLQIFSQEKYEDRLFVPVFGDESFKKKSLLNWVGAEHHLEKVDSVFWLCQVAANAKMYG